MSGFWKCAPSYGTAEVAAGMWAVVIVIGVPVTAMAGPLRHVARLAQ
ncbi:MULTISPECIES: hypothetical protein [unclassified Streptomyces]